MPPIFAPETDKHWSPRWRLRSPRFQVKFFLMKINLIEAAECGRKEEHRGKV